MLPNVLEWHQQTWKIGQQLVLNSMKYVKNCDNRHIYELLCEKCQNWSKFGYKRLRNGNKYPFPHLAPIDLLFKIHTHVDLQSTARYTDTVM